MSDGASEQSSVVDVCATNDELGADENDDSPQRATGDEGDSDVASDDDHGDNRVVDHDDDNDDDADDADDGPLAPTVQNGGDQRDTIDDASSDVDATSDVAGDTASDSDTPPPKVAHRVLLSSAPLERSSATSNAAVASRSTGERSPKSLTRQPNLPEKPKSEDKKHSKQYLQMLLTYNKKVRKEQAEQERLEKEKLRKEQRKIANRKQWETVLEKWPKVRASKAVRRLVWEGVPPTVRGRVWRCALGNELHVTADLFDIFRRRASDAKRDNAAALQGREATVRLIDLDLPRTFPALSFFQPDGPMAPQLADVLEAYVCYRPDIGYVQGMSYLAAFLLLNMDTLEAFQCLSNLLNRRVLLAFFKMNQDVVQRYMALLQHLMRTYCPRVHATFAQQGLVPETFVIDWVLTLFSKSLPLEIATRLWDVYLYEDEVFLFRAIIGLLRMLSSSIQSNDFDTNMHLMTHLPADMDSDALFRFIAGVPLSESELNSAIRQFVVDEK